MIDNNERKRTVSSWTDTEEESTIMKKRKTASFSGARPGCYNEEIVKSS